MSIDLRLALYLCMMAVLPVETSKMDTHRSDISSKASAQPQSPSSRKLISPLPSSPPSLPPFKSSKSTCKRRRDGTLVISSWPLFLGTLEIEAYALRPAHDLPRGLPLTFKFAKPAKSFSAGKKPRSKEKTDRNVRFTVQSFADLSLGRLPVGVADYLHPLATAEIVMLEGELGDISADIKVLDAVKVRVGVSLCERAINGNANQTIEDEEFAQQRQALLRLFSALGLERTGSAINTSDTALEGANLSGLLEFKEDLELEETTPPPSFPTALYTHQKQALTWMLEREGHGLISLKSQELHPLWEEYRMGESRIYHNICSGEIALERPHAQETCQGGILADEMGLGKTVTLAALLHANPPPEAAVAHHKRTKTASSAQGKTLIVVPLSLLEQWQVEVKTHCPQLNCVSYYGASRHFKPSADITLTTYGIVASEHSSSGPLFKTSWFRLVLDEGHAIRNGQTATAKACMQLKALHKWVLTGTPILNSLEDLSSLLKLLDCDKGAIANLMHRKELAVIRKMLRPILLRRTKQSHLTSGAPLIVLPLLEIEVRKVDLTDLERSQYDKLKASCHAAFQAMESTGVLKRCFATLFEMVLRLRQSCDHYSLLQSACTSAEHIDAFVAKTLEDPLSPFAAELTEKLKSGIELDCPVCLGPAEDALLPPCGHLMCRPCAYHQIESNGNCPLCKRKLKVADLKTAPRRIRSSLGRELRPSSKVTAVLHELQRSSDQYVVFSQWLGMLDILESALQEAQHTFVRLDGTMSLSQRESALLQFRKGGIKVLLVSIGAGGTGLSLACAHRVILLEPLWSDAQEKQAIERLHRIGQTSPVSAVRLIVSNSIEEQIAAFNSTQQRLSAAPGLEDLRRLLTAY